MQSTATFQDAGIAVMPDVLNDEDCDALCGEIARLVQDGEPTNGRAGLRNLLRRSELVRSVASSQSVRGIVDAIAGADAFAVRALWFDKNVAANWAVAWHQDVMIAVAERIELPGYAAWSVKSGVQHARPPAAVLEQMVSVRLHVDPCGVDNGALQVIPGSHRQGVLDDACLDSVVSASESRTCACDRGDAVVMRPLLVHSSLKAVRPTNRRVLHLEFAGCELQEPLQWFERI